MCRFANVPLADGQPGPTSVKVCDGTGNMNACQLCPQSLTYWRLTDEGQTANPWDGTPRDGTTADTSDTFSPLADKAHLINGEGWHMGAEGPCVLCLKRTKLHSPKGFDVTAKRCGPNCVNCHKACAEEYRAGRRVFAEPR